MPDEHARLAPSASSRWISCPGSVRLSEAIGRKESTTPAATEGTLAHELAEMRASLLFGKITAGAYATWHTDWQRRCGLTNEQLVEMHRHVDSYVQLLRHRMSSHPHSQLQLEQSLPSGIEGCWGTSDAVIVSPTHIEVVDLKYGKGLRVNAATSSQLRLYGLGALDMYSDVLGETEEITLTIFQPRMDNVASVTLTPAELRAWREEIRPVAAEALLPGARFAPGEDTCRFCPAAGQCTAQMRASTAADFGTPAELLTPEQMAESLRLLPQIRSWCDAVVEASLHRAYSEGVRIPGWKVVSSGGRRVITDPPAAIQTLIDAGYTAGQVAQVSIKGIGALESLLGKGGLEPLIGDLMSRTPGKPAIVPQEDGRPEITPAGEAMAEFCS